MIKNGASKWTQRVLKLACFALFSSVMIIILPTKPATAADTFVYNATVGTDSLNRSLPLNSDTGDVKGNRYVGLFYFLNSFFDIGPYDMEFLYRKYPDSVLDNRRPEWGGIGTNHLWGNPLYGYYDHHDPWVIRKDLQMLGEAGVDFIVFDTTNVPTYDTVLENLLDVMQDLYDQGAPVPKIAFYTNTDSGSTMEYIYDRYYKTGAPDRHPDLWFNWRSKPMIVGISSQASSAVSSFFTIKEAQWPTEAPKDNGFPWIDFVRPQQVHTYNGQKEIMSVSPAQNSGSLLFSDNAFHGLPSTWGRGYHNGMHDDSLEAVNSGYNFIEQWNNAIAQDPPMVFITGWNEWMAGIWDGIGNHKVNSYDAATMAYSRDIQPMKEGFKDNYYMLLAKYIREYKGFNAMPTPSADTTITINTDFSQWSDVSPAYKDYTGDTAARDYRGYGALYFNNNSGRNDIDVMKVARDSNNLYFYVKCVENISSYTDSSWMRLFINTDGNPTNGWNGFDYVINRTGVTAGTTTLEQSTGGWNWSTVNANIIYSISGKEMMIQIPRNDLGLIGDPVNIAFKWADNMQNDGDVMDFYVNGDTAPDGRLSYAYYTDESVVITPSPTPASMPGLAPIAENVNVPGTAKSWEFVNPADLEGWKVDTVKTDMYNASAARTTVAIGSADVAAEKFTTTSWVNRIELLSPVYTGSGTGLRLSLYKWDTDYGTTINGAPFMTYIHNSVSASNPWIYVWTQTALPPGDYLWTVSLSSTPVANAGVIKSAGSYSGTTSYFNGVPIADHYTMRMSGPSMAAFGVTEEQALKGTVSMNNSYTVLKKDADIDLADKKVVQIRMSNATNATSAKLYFTTAADVTAWNFDSNLENWIASANVGGFTWQTGGYIGGNVTGPDPFLVSPDNLGIDAANHTIIKVKLKNGTSNTTGQIYFTTTSDTNWSEAKSVTFPIHANDSNYTEYSIDMTEAINGLWSGTINRIRIDPNKDVSSGSFSMDSVAVVKTAFSDTNSKSFTINANSDYTVYNIDMSDVAGWSGTLKRIKFVPAVNASSGSFGIDYIRIFNDPAKAWYFNSTIDDWTASGDISGFGWQTGGYAGGEIIGSDPYLFSTDNLGIDADDNTIIRIKMKNDSSNTTGKFYFTTNSDASWTEAKSKTFTLTANDSRYTEYFIDMSEVPGWSGTLKQLRFDPNQDASSGSFSIDEITISNAAMYTQSRSFSSTQGVNGWSYEEWIWDGATRTINNMTWDSTNNRWIGTSADSFVGAGIQQPDLNKESVQVFTAPASGTVRIMANVRRSVSNAASDGVQVKIKKNDQDWWPIGGGFVQVSDMTGIVIDQIAAVTAGDQFQFVVNSKASSVYDAVYFDPTITYYGGVWNFDSTVENWTAGGNTSGFGWQSDGYMGGNVTGTDPNLTSADHLGIRIVDHHFIKIGMKNATAAKTAKFYFTTNADPTWNEAKSKTFATIANDPNYTEYVVDMSTVPGWTGVLRQLRFDPEDSVSTGSFSIDYIRF